MLPAPNLSYCPVDTHVTLWAGGWYPTCPLASCAQPEEGHRTALALIVHTERGSQYDSKAHRDLLAHHGLIVSMSGNGN